MVRKLSVISSAVWVCPSSAADDGPDVVRHLVRRLT